MTQRSRRGLDVAPASAAGGDSPVGAAGPGTPAGGRPEPLEALAALALSRRPGVGAASFKALLAEYGSPRRALEAYDARPSGPPTRPKAALVEGMARARDYLEAGGFLTYLGGPGYPSALAELGEPPPVLFVRGRPEALAGPLLAVVGARAAGGEALAEARALAGACARAGVGVASGGALGVDAAAHEGALDAGGVTAALLGSGVDVVYPRAHVGLFARVIERGALASELLPGTAARATFFPTRNRLVAGVARAAVVVRGGAQSGALITARWARALGRPVFVLRAPPEDPLGEANRALAAAGAIELAGPEAIAPWLAAIAGGAGAQSFKISRAAL